MIKGISRKKIAKVFNAMATANSVSEQINLDATKQAQDKSFKIIKANLENNFIMENIINVIRNQAYSDLKSNSLLEKDFGFWLTGEQGEEIIYENTISGSSRTGDIVTDVANISDEPQSEIQILELSDNYAVDLKMNAQIQQWATLDKAVNWINKRLDNLRKSVEKPVHANMLAEVNSYIGYTEILIDPTGLTEEQIALEMEKAIGEQVTALGADYNSDNNSLGFDNILDPSDAGLILSTKASVNRNINYIRKVINTQDQKLDWGFGHITVKPLIEDEQAIILPREKYIAGAQFGSIDSTFGFALIENLKTEYVFYGSVFMESAPAIRITASTPAAYKSKLEKAKADFIKLMKERLAKISQAKELDAAHKKLAETQIDNLIKYAEAYSVAKVMKNVKVITPNPEDQILKVKIHGEMKNEDSANDETVKNLTAELAQAQANLLAQEESTKEIKAKAKEEVASLKDELNKAKQAAKTGKPTGDSK